MKRHRHVERAATPVDKIVGTLIAMLGAAALRDYERETRHRDALAALGVRIDLSSDCPARGAALRQGGAA